ncbi:MAG: hypothetical protein CMH32_00410 [Micavibrio sp.]|nr:hypothetical protein [Micavibrio sp.]HCK33047.1 hypothetical protein [Rhodospirillaceae bacterium]|tara:strand:+ start:366 stop:1289 length:924 start_codon:yes stop_codon:yes gene_type:complete
MIDIIDFLEYKHNNLIPESTGEAGISFAWLDGSPDDMITKSDRKHTIVILHSLNSSLSDIGLQKWNNSKYVNNTRKEQEVYKKTFREWLYKSISKNEFSFEAFSFVEKDIIRHIPRITENLYLNDKIKNDANNIILQFPNKAPYRTNSHNFNYIILLAEIIGTVLYRFNKQDTDKQLFYNKRRLTFFRLLLDKIKGDTLTDYKNAQILTEILQNVKLWKFSLHYHNSKQVSKSALLSDNLAGLLNKAYKNPYSKDATLLKICRKSILNGHNKWNYFNNGTWEDFLLTHEMQTPPSKKKIKTLGINIP